MFDAIDAKEMSRKLYIYTEGDPWNVVNGNMDAFRHSYWNIVGSLAAGTAYMKLFADAHENTPHVISREKSMDLINNRLGRTYFTENESVIKDFVIGNDWLAYKVRRELVRSGRLVRFSGDNFDSPVFCGTDSLEKNNRVKINE